MEPMLVLIGLFLFGAILSNKELTKDKRYRDYLAYLTIIVLFLLLSGLGFLLAPSQYMFPNYSFLIMMFLFIMALMTVASGKAKSIVTIAGIGTLVFILMGSFR